MKLARELEALDDESGGGSPAARRLVSLVPQVTLGRVVGELRAGRCSVKVGRRVVDARLDESVDPAIVGEAFARGSRVVLEIDDDVRVVGTLQTTRVIHVDSDGDVSANVRRFSVSAEEDVLLKTSGSFFRLETHRVEAYANEFLARGRHVVRLLGTMIKLN